MAISGRRLARRCVVQALYQWRMTGQEPSEIPENFIANENLTGKHLDYFLLLINRIPGRIKKIDQHIKVHLDRDINKVDLIEQAILRLGVYELVYAPDIPAKVVLNEAVDLAKIFCSENGYQYVNGVLDKIAHDVRGELAEQSVE